MTHTDPPIFHARSTSALLESLKMRFLLIWGWSSKMATVFPFSIFLLLIRCSAISLQKNLIRSVRVLSFTAPMRWAQSISSGTMFLTFRYSAKNHRAASLASGVDSLELQGWILLVKSLDFLRKGENTSNTVRTMTLLITHLGYL